MASTKKPQKKHTKAIEITIKKSDTPSVISSKSQKNISKKTPKTTKRTSLRKKNKVISQKKAPKKAKKPTTSVVHNLIAPQSNPTIVKFFRFPTIRSNFSSLRLPKVQTEDTVFMGAFVFACAVLVYVASVTTTLQNYGKIFTTDVLASFTSTPQVSQSKTPVPIATSSDQLKQAINTSIDTNEQKARQALMGFYINMNNQDFSQAYQSIQTNLYKTDIFQQYFSPQRLQKFLSFIENNKIKVSSISFQEDKENPDRLIASYTITYTLNINQTIYKENWITKLKNVDDRYQIVEFMCETKGCSRMPFFNFEKFGLK